MLNRKATAAGLKVQDFIRMTLAKGYVSNIDTPEQHEVKRQLIRLSNNLNQETTFTMNDYSFQLINGILKLIAFCHHQPPGKGCYETKNGKQCQW